MPKQTVTRKKPTIPVGFRKFKYCTGGYKSTVIGKLVDSENPVWAESRYDKKERETYYRLYTYIPN